MILCRFFINFRTFITKNIRIMKYILPISKTYHFKFYLFSICLLFMLVKNDFNLHAQNIPEENRFTKVILGDKLDEPLEMTLLKDGRVLFIERKGALKQYDPNTGAIKTLALQAVTTLALNMQKAIIFSW